MNNTYTYHSNQVYDRDFAVDYHDFGRGDPMTYLLAGMHTGAMGYGRGEDRIMDGMTQERNDLMVFSSDYYQQKHVYTAGGERIEQFTDRTAQSGGNGGLVRMLYVHEDIVGNTMYYTKDTGSSFCELRYDVWGFPDLSGKLQNNDNGNFAAATFEGHIYDTVIDVYFAEARFYDAANRQWMAGDPIKSGLNWYSYVNDNPTTWFDPTGLKPYTFKIGKTDKGNELYSFSPQGVLYDTVLLLAADSIQIPFVGEIAMYGANRLFGFEKITDNNMSNLLESDTMLDLLSSAVDAAELASLIESKLGILETIFKNGAKISKVAGEVVSIAGYVVTGLEIVSLLTDEEQYALDEAISTVFGKYMIGSSRDIVIAKYIYALSAVPYLIESGVIKFDYNFEMGYFNIFSYCEKDEDLQKVISGLEAIESRNSALIKFDK